MLKKLEKVADAWRGGERVFRVVEACVEEVREEFRQPGFGRSEEFLE